MFLLFGLSALLYVVSDSHRLLSKNENYLIKFGE